MSILDNISSISPAQNAANNMRNQARDLFGAMVNVFNSGSQEFWNNSNATPEEIANELGSDAKEIFELHSKLGQLIASVKPLAIEEGLSLVGNFTLNDNGTVSIITQVPTPSTTNEIEITPEPTPNVDSET